MCKAYSTCAQSEQENDKKCSLEVEKSAPSTRVAHCQAHVVKSSCVRRSAETASATSDSSDSSQQLVGKDEVIFRLRRSLSKHDLCTWSRGMNGFNFLY